MNKICTDIHQSQKLIELGIAPQTADMIYYWFDNFELDDEWYELHLGTNRINCKDIPAWSLSALLDIMPKVESVGYEQYPILEHDDEGYEISSPIYNTDYYDNPIDACYEMIIKLKEKGLL